MKTIEKFLNTLVSKSAYGKTLLQQRKFAYWERLSQVFAIMILAVFPLTMGFDGYADIARAKYALFKAFMGFYMAAAAVITAEFLIEQKMWQARKAEGLHKWNLSQVLITAFVLWGVICAIVSPFHDLWVGQSRYEGVLSMLLYAAIFILLSFWGEYCDYYVPAMAVMAVIEGLICLAQLWGVNWIYLEGYDFATTEFIGTIGNIDIVGGMIATVVPALACGYILLETRWRYVMLSGAAMLLLVELWIDVDSAKIGMLFAFAVCLPFLAAKRKFFSRTLRIGSVFSVVFALAKMFTPLSPAAVTFGKLSLAAVVLAAVLGAASWLLERKERDFRWSAKTINLVVAGAEILLVIAALLYLRGYEGSSVLLTDIRNVLHGELADSAGTNRGFVWKACIELMAAAPVFGCGPGGFYEAFTPYNREELGVMYDFAHNDFLQVGVCMGYVGLALYIAFLVVLAVKTIKAANRCPLVIIFAASVAGYLAHSFFSFSITIVTPLYWVMAGLLDKLIRQMPQELPPSGGKERSKHKTKP